ncbi:hypothetical protein MMC07_002691 [Pseudocyphellaria aurata]|nr:hypothetical protein [Pseudocyphellaria aurata]
MQQNFTEADVTDTKDKLDALILAIESHPLLTDDPGRDAPRALYFTWDFIRRTEFNLSHVDIPALLTNDEVALEAYNDCLGRIMLSGMIVEDPIKCAMITQSEAVDFGAEVRARVTDFRFMNT